MELMMQHLGQGLFITLLLSMPCVLAAAGIGLVVGILQAVTQVQEQTIAAAPKIIGVFSIIIFGGGLMMNILQGYVRESVQIAFNEIPQDGIFILPPKASSPNKIRAKAFFSEQLGSDMVEGRMKAFIERQGREREEAAGNSTMLFRNTPQPGSSLGVAERMTLQKGR